MIYMADEYDLWNGEMSNVNLCLMKSCAWHDSVAHTRVTSRTHAPPPKIRAARTRLGVGLGAEPPKGLMLESPLATAIRGWKSGFSTELVRNSPSNL